ncbi:hypothetical protein [Actinomadura sp. KC216]|uniref:hypothetical protein n=1 Tax=Actinomadura sp. KC216 TaxID=2530370 RepID=UPI001A9E3CC2|nr:hypothetical protein [Actinomadura sp. KC216]
MKVAVYGAGAALIVVGVRGVLVHLAHADAVVWLAWFAGAAVLHDGVLVPLVLAAGAATSRVPAAYRRIVRAALIVAGCVCAVALPLVLGYGRRADEPSRLPLPYGRNLAIVLALITVVAAVAVAVRAHTARRAGRKERT